MEMAEYRDDGIWEVVPNGSTPVHLVEPEGRRSLRRRRTSSMPAPRPRLIGWSLVMVGTSNIGLVVIAVVIGMSPIGLLACAALALSSWLLVVAEVLSLRRLYETSDR